jgi:hypothetical protein
MKKNLSNYEKDFSDTFLSNNKSQYDFNINNKNIPVILSIDSSQRNNITNPKPNKYSILLDQSYNEIISLELIYANIPKSIYNITEFNNTLHFQETTNGPILEAVLLSGNYTINELITELTNRMNDAYLSIGTYTIVIEPFTLCIKITQTLAGSSNTFNLIFFERDELDFKNGNKSKKIYKEKSIGYILGFEPKDLTNVPGPDSFFTSLHPYNINPLSYINLYINKDSRYSHVHSNNDASKGCFCIIPLNTTNNYFQYKKESTFINNNFIKEFITPIPSLKQLDIEFRDGNNNLYEFNNQEHLLIFEIKQCSKI